MNGSVFALSTENGDPLNGMLVQPEEVYSVVGRSTLRCLHNYLATILEDPIVPDPKHVRIIFETVRPDIELGWGAFRLGQALFRVGPPWVLTPGFRFMDLPLTVQSPRRVIELVAKYRKQMGQKSPLLGARLHVLQGGVVRVGDQVKLVTKEELQQVISS